MRLACERGAFKCQLLAQILVDIVGVLTDQLRAEKVDLPSYLLPKLASTLGKLHFLKNEFQAIEVHQVQMSSHQQHKQAKVREHELPSQIFADLDSLHQAILQFDTVSLSPDLIKQDCRLRESQFLNIKISHISLHGLLLRL